MLRAKRNIDSPDMTEADNTHWFSSGESIIMLKLTNPMTRPNVTTNGRPRSSRAQIVAATCEVFIAVAACFGVFSFYHSIQVAKVQNAEEAIARLYPLDVNVNQALGQRAKARESLYEDPNGIVYAGLTEEDKSVFKDACAALGGVFEYYLLIRDDVRHHPKGEEIIQSWDGYIEATCHRSFGFRGYINATRKTWAPMFLAEFDKYTAALPFPPGDQ